MKVDERRYAWGALQFLVLALALLVTAVALGLRWLNLRHLARNAHVVPAELRSSVDPETLAGMARYSAERGRFGVFTSLVARLALLACLYLGPLGMLDRWVVATTDSTVKQGVLFALAFSIVAAVVNVPFELYATFRLEARHGFNRTTPGLWWSDWLKGFALSLLFTAAMAAAALLLVTWSPQRWWLWVWALLTAFTLLMMIVSPYVIEPLFFKLTPLRVEGLEQQVRALAERGGVQVSRVLQMDASRRSSHSNAYFTGIGPVKRVVLFDTLLARMTHSQILAVLAHELGHWKRRHILQRLLMGQLLTLAGCYFAYVLIGWPHLPALVGLESASLPARVTIVAFVAALLQFPLTPLFSAWSRHHEREADDFARELTGKPEDLASALVQLARDNLSNLHPHPAYAAFYASHPPMVERIRRLRGAPSAEGA